MTDDYTSELMDLAFRVGATLVGVADLNEVKTLSTHPPNLFESYKYAISIAVSLPKSVFNLITVENPGEIYAHHYRTSNLLLDQITLRLSEKIIQRGYSALAIPASLSLGDNKLSSNAPHKAFARSAGLGWIGKNLLLITPNYGPRVRLATVLTDIPLSPGKPLENFNCGICSKCIEACPIKALKSFDFKGYPVKRENILDAVKCQTRLEKISEMEFIGVSICGICIKVCPIGK
ncbi:MAG: 4Fe-4S double cluster binding domain-containing protein [Promethearchaeota archaeon]